MAFTAGTPTTNSKLSVDDVISYLNNLLPHKNWFVAGSAAVDINYNDIDVFFRSKSDLDTALVALKQLHIEESHHSGAANSFYFSSTLVQFVRCRFGTPQQITESFDFTLCKKAILPDSSIYEHPDFHLHKFDIVPGNIGSDVFKRIKKYERKGYYCDAGTKIKVIDYMLDNLTKTVRNYYTDADITFEQILLHEYIEPFLVCCRVDAKLPIPDRLAFYNEFIYESAQFTPNAALSPEYHAILALRGISSESAATHYPEYLL